MLSSLVVALVTITTCNANIGPTPGTGVLNPPGFNELNQQKAENWHNDELCPKLKSGLFTDLFFDTRYFPNKWDDTNIHHPPFEFKVDSDTYTRAEFKKVVDGVQRVSQGYLNGLVLDGCVFEPDGYQKDNTGYSIQSKQTTKFMMGPLSPTLSVTEVTYSFDTGDFLKSVQMVTISDEEYTVAGAIQSLKGTRRRLTEQEPVQMLMNMPNAVSIPLIIAIVGVFVFIEVLLFWRTIDYCRSLVFGRKVEIINDMELTKV
eukprot:268623_1